MTMMNGRNGRNGPTVGQDVPVIEITDMTKIYRMGETSVHALNGLLWKREITPCNNIDVIVIRSVYLTVLVFFNLLKIHFILLIPL